MAMDLGEEVWEIVVKGDYNSQSQKLKVESGLSVENRGMAIYNGAVIDQG